MRGWGELALRVTASGGLGIWHMRPKALRRRRSQHAACSGCHRRHHRLIWLFGVLAGLQLAGILGLVTLGLGAPVCPAPAWFPPADAAAYTRENNSAAVRLGQLVTAGPTGLALLYGKARGADVCRFAPNGTLVARMSSGFARGGTMYGHAFLTYPRHGLTYEELVPLKQHESRHTAQWATFTALGGPLAFPLTYAADEAIAPGVHNHFEQAAGLSDGNYPDPDGPSPATSRLLILLAAVGVVWFEHHRFRRHLRLLATFVRHRKEETPWWHAHTEPVGPGPLAEQRRLWQLGCAGCGHLPAKPPSIVHR
ncbi:hypothetical protein OWR29_04525 [Actinoplanes sp. Pm04-4]|uniref:Uncharacterized protein n=1 Tax=Paractinoplanes pyxinae TaxID=2997416 RepID=A0ABT4ASP6_9ACTN|nr:hypothetical protein [Actinoplanes pyxinae]MCY1137254.1 hypothetical protein [Actinoplanes pyxinae]